MRIELTDEMTLQEKLDAIDKAMLEAKDKPKHEDKGHTITTTIDPADLLVCDGCQ